MMCSVFLGYINNWIIERLLTDIKLGKSKLFALLKTNIVGGGKIGRLYGVKLGRGQSPALSVFPHDPTWYISGKIFASSNFLFSVRLFRRISPSDLLFCIFGH